MRLYSQKKQPALPKKIYLSLQEFNMKSAFGLILFSGIVSALWARPAAPNVYNTVDNGDSKLTLVNHGDEHYHYATTQDGYLVLPDQSGTYVYADTNGKPSNVIAHDKDLRLPSENEFLEQLDESQKQNILKKHEAIYGGRFPDESEQPGALILRSSSSPQPLNRPTPQKWVSGERYIPTLLVGTTDIPHADSAAVYDLLNKEGYNKNGNIGSLRDYYLHSSNGKLDIHFDIYPLPLNVAQTSFGSGSNFSEGNYTKAGIDALVKHPNFKANANKYCAEGTTVDGFLFLFPGEEQNALKQSDYFWGHKYQMIYNGAASQWSKGYTAGGYTFDAYLFIAQYRDNSNNSKLNAMGIFAHEFSHVLGLPDMYSGSGTNFVSGPTPYDVMTQGMYNGNWETPPSFSAFEREAMGWMTIKEMSPNSSYVMRDISKMEAFSVSNPNQNDEYYIVEYRPAVKYDAYIQNNGVYVWYIDYDAYAFENAAVNSNKSHQRVAMNKVVQKGGYYADFTFVNKSGRAGIPGVYNFVLEGDTLACFTTNSAMPLSKCPTPEPLSSSSGISSSSENPSDSEVSSSSQQAEPTSSTTGFAPTVASRLKLHVEGSTLHINTASASPKEVAIFDMLGNKILAERFAGRDYSLNLGNLDHKVYMVRVTENGKSLTQKTFAF